MSPLASAQDFAALCNLKEGEPTNRGTGMKVALVGLLALLACLLAPAPAWSRDSIQLASVHAVLGDLEERKDLYAKRDDIPVPIASVTNLMTAIASYGCYLHKGKFAPTPWFFGRFIQNTKWLDKPNSRGSGMISALTFQGGQLEYPIARGGLFLQFLKQKNPAAFSTSMSRFLLGRASADSLVQKCVGEIKSEMLDGEFENFVKAFIENYKPVKRE